MAVELRGGFVSLLDCVSVAGFARACAWTHLSGVCRAGDTCLPCDKPYTHSLAVCPGHVLVASVASASSTRWGHRVHPPVCVYQPTGRAASNTAGLLMLP